MANMDPEQFRKWRNSLGLNQQDIADLFGLKKWSIQTRIMNGMENLLVF